MKRTKLRKAAALALLVAVPLATVATVASVTASKKALAADHLDAPGVMADKASDITDLYTFMDGTNVVYALDVGPLADATLKFSDKVQYVIHTESTDKFGTPGLQQDIIATFDTAQKLQLWIGSDIYLTGDASATAGLASTDGKVKVFAGLRDDPFFFNFTGFTDAVADVDTAETTPPGLTVDPAGCPQLNAATATFLANDINHTMHGTMPPADFFAGKNVLAIVLSIDKSLLNKGGPLIAAWASTNKGL